MNYAELRNEYMAAKEDFDVNNRGKSVRLWQVERKLVAYAKKYALCFREEESDADVQSVFNVSQVENPAEWKAIIEIALSVNLDNCTKSWNEL